MSFITLDFFYTIRAFYAWVFPPERDSDRQYGGWPCGGHVFPAEVPAAAGLWGGVPGEPGGHGAHLAAVPFGIFDSFLLCLRLVRGGGASLPLYRHGGALSLDQDPRTIKSHDIVVWRKAGRNGPEVSGPALSALLWKELFYGRK